MTTRTRRRIPESIDGLAADVALCSECFPEITVTGLPGGVWEIRAVHTPECCRPEDLVYG